MYTIQQNLPSKDCDVSLILFPGLYRPTKPDNYLMQFLQMGSRFSISCPSLRAESSGPSLGVGTAVTMVTTTIASARNFAKNCIV